MLPNTANAANANPFGFAQPHQLLASASPQQMARPPMGQVAGINSAAAGAAPGVFGPQVGQVAPPPAVDPTQFAVAQPNTQFPLAPGPAATPSPVAAVPPPVGMAGPPAVTHAAINRLRGLGMNGRR